MVESGGGGEIRTHGNLRSAGFQDRCFHPLSHPSVGSVPRLTQCRQTLSTGQHRFAQCALILGGERSPLELTRLATYARASFFESLSFNRKEKHHADQPPNFSQADRRFDGCCALHSPVAHLGGRDQAQLAADHGLHRHGQADRAACWAASSARTRRCWPSATWTPPAARTPRSGSTSSTPSRPDASGECAAYNDFREIIDRKDIDAVCIATPDHWHAIITLAALRAGKDVYCEKPLTHNIHEAVEVMRAVDANKRVLQTGSMQRSIEGVPHGLRAGAQRRHRQDRARRVQLRRPGRPLRPAGGADGAGPGLEPVGRARRRCGPTTRSSARAACTSISPTGGTTANSAAAWSPTGARTISTSPSGAWAWTTAARWKSCRRRSRAPSAAPSWSMPTASPWSTRTASASHFFGTEGEVQVNRGQFAFKRGSEMIASFADNKDREDLLRRAGAEGGEGVPAGREDQALRQQEPPLRLHGVRRSRARSRSPASRSAGTRPSAAT